MCPRNLPRFRLGGAQFTLVRARTGIVPIQLPLAQTDLIIFRLNVVCAETF